LKNKRTNPLSIKQIILCSLLIVLPIHLYCQSDYLQTYTTTEGLSQNSVNCAIQTSEGYLWLGTYDGLNRFDGKNFKSYRIDNVELKMQVPPSKLINSLHMDQNDLMWVATSNSTVLFDRKKNKFYNPEKIYTNCKIGEALNVTEILSDKNDNIFLFTINNLFVYNFKTKTLKKIVNESVISDISFGINGNIIIAKGDGVYAYNKNGLEKIVQLENESPLRIESNGFKIWTITDNFNIYEYDVKSKELENFYTKYNFSAKLLDPHKLYFKDDNLWVGTRSEGLRKIELSTQKVTTFLAKNNRNSLQTNFILSIQSTSKGITVIGQSGGGFAIYDNIGYGIDLYRAESDKFGLSLDNMILSLKKINSKEMVAGTISSGLQITNLETKAVQYYDIPPSDNFRPESKNIYTIIKIDTELYMASWGGLLVFDLDTKKFTSFFNNDKQSRLLTSVLHLPNLNKLLLGGYEGGLLYFDLKTKVFEPVKDPYKYLTKNFLNVRYMKQVNDTEVWMSTEKSGLVKYDLVSGNFSPFDQVNMHNGTSRHFNTDEYFIWVATDAGLVQLDKSTQKLQKIWTKSDGLANDFIYSTFTDASGKVWVTSNYGISIINLDDKTIINLTEKHGLQSLEFNTASIDIDDKGNYYLGGTNGFNVIDPNFFEVDHKIKSPVITNISVRNEPKEFANDVQFVDTIILDYRDNYIDIQFQVPDLSLNKNEVFKYKLSDVDDEFVITNRNYVNYSNLKYGIYNFEIFASNINGDWSPPKRLTILIKTPWYKQWWFLILRGVVVISLTYFFLRWYINLVNSKMSMQKDYALKVKNLEIDNLRSQMNPHFLFNALNSINSYIVKNEIHLASDYLSKFSKLMRMILEHSKQKNISLFDEIETLELYLKIESIRFEKSFEYTVTIDKDLNAEEIFIPPLIIQPFVENAIWHGIQHHNKKGILKIKICKSGENQIQIVIEDNGVGRAKAKELKSKSGGGKKSYGIIITNERIKHSHDSNAIEIEDLYDNTGNPKGTRVTLILYLNDKN
jgi:ligand-binding sensor domain-containing protein